MNPISSTVLHICYKLGTTVVHFSLYQKKIGKNIFKDFICLWQFDICTVVLCLRYKFCVYEVMSGVFVAVLVLCLGHWCPLVDWSSSISRLNLFLHC